MSYTGQIISQPVSVKIVELDSLIGLKGSEPLF